MRYIKFFFLSAASFFLFNLLVINVWADDAAKTDKYLQLLLKKTDSSYLFDRFYDSWDDNERGSLEQFLEENWRKSGKPEYLSLLAKFYEKEGQDEKALYTYDKLLKKVPDQPDALFASAQLKFYSGRMKGAMDDLEKMLASSKLQPSLEEKGRKLFGRIYVRNGEPEKGLKEWSKLLDQDSGDNTELAEEVIQLMLDEGLYDDAIKACKSLQAKVPGQYRKVALGIRLGGIYRLKGEREKATAEFAAVLDKTGSGSWIEKEIYSQIEHGFTAEDDIEGLLKFYQQRLEKTPGNPSLLQRYADLLYRNGDDDKALEQYRKLVKLTPLDYKNRELYVDMLTKSGKYDDALAVMAQLRKALPNDAELVIKQARLEYEAGNTKACVASFEKYLEMSSGEYAWSRVAKMLNEYGMKNEAGNIFRQMIRKFPDSPDAGELYAKYLYDSGDKKTAVEQLIGFAGKEDVSRCMRVVQNLLAWNEVQAAYTLMEERWKDFNGDFKFNEEFFNLSCSLKKYDEAEKLVDRMLNTAATPGELARALSASEFVLKNRKNVDAWIARLGAARELTEKQYCLLAQLEYGRGDAEKALKDINQGLSKYPKSLLLYSRALYYYKNLDDADQAEHCLKEMLKLAPGRRVEYLRELVALNQRAGKIESALKWIAQWKRIQPEAVIPWLTEANIYVRAGNMDKAVVTLKKACFKFPDNNQLAGQLAEYQILNMNVAAAMNIFWKMLGNEKNLEQRLAIVEKIARLADQNGSRDVLLSRLRNRMKANPKNIFPLLALARVYKAYGDYNEYRYYLMKAVEKQDNNVDLLYNVALADEAEGNYEKAESVLRKALDIDKSDKTRKQLAAFYFRSGEEDKAFDLLFKTAPSEKMTAEEVKTAAGVMLSAGQYEKMVSFLKYFVSRYPDNCELRYYYAIALEESGKTTEAVREFITLLGMKDKFKDKPTAANANSGFYFYATKNLPPIVREVIDLQQSSYRVYYYRNRQSYASGIMPYSYTSSSSAALLPSDRQGFVNYIIVHLANLVNSEDKNSFNDICDELVRTGMKYPDVKLIFANRNSQSMQDKWDDVIEKYGEDINVIIINCMIGSVFRQGNIDIDKSKKLFDKVKVKHPDVAAMLFFSILQQNGKPDKEMTEEVITFIGKQDKIEFFMLSIINQLFQKKIISDDEMKRLLHNIAECLLKDKDNAAKNNMYYFVPQLLFGLFKVGDYEMCAKVMKYELERTAGSATRSGAMSIYPYYYRSYAGNTLGFNPIAFPPQNSGVISPVIAEFLRGTRHFSGTNMPITKEMKEGLWKACSTIKGNVFQLLLGAYCDKDEAAAKAADAILKDKNSDAEAIVTAAGYFGSRNQNDKAFNALVMAAEKARDKNTRKDLYVKIIYYGDKAKENKAGKEIIREYSKKLLLLGLSDQEKGQLAIMLQRAGLTEEAEKIDHMLLKKLTGKGGSSTAPKAVVSSAYSARAHNVYERIDNLLKDGKVEMGMKIAWRSMRQLLTPFLVSMKTGGYNYNVPWEAKRIAELLQQKNCTKIFIKDYRPQENAPVRRRLEFALMCELLGDKTEAEAEYRKVLEEKPDDTVANLRMTLLYLSKDINKAKGFLCKVKLVKNPVLILQMFNQIQYSPEINNDLEKKLEIIDLLTEFIKATPPDKFGNNLHLVANYFSNLGNSMYSNKWGQIPGVLEENPQFSGNKEKKREIYDKAVKTYMDLCNVCIKIPALAEDAFGYKLTLLKVHDKKPTDEVFKEGLNVCKSQNRNLTRYVYTSRNDLVNVDDFMLEYALTHNKTDELLNAYTKVYQKENVKLAKKLFDCKPEDFFNILDKYRAEQKNNDGTSLNVAILVLKLRKLDTQLSKLNKLILENLKSQIDSNLQQSYLNLARQYISALSGKSKVTETFLTDLVKVIVAKYKELYPDGNIMDSSGTRQFAQIVTTLTDYAVNENKGDVFPIMAVVLNGLKQNTDILKDANLEYVYSRFSGRIPAEAILTSPFVGSVAQFDFLPTPNRNNNMPNIFCGFIQHTRYNQKQREACIDQLDKISPETFGREFLAEFFKAKHGNEIFKVCSKYIVEFDKLPEDRRKEFCVQLSETLRCLSINYENMNKSDSGWVFYDKYFSKLGQQELADEIADFMKQDVDDNYYSYLNEVKKLIRTVAEQDPEKALKILNHALTRMKIFAATGRGYFGQRGVEEQMANSLLDYQVNSLPELAVIFKFMVANKMFTNRIMNRFIERLGSVSRNRYQQLNQTYSTRIKDSTSSQYLAARDFIRELQKYFDYKGAPLLFPAFDFLNNNLNKDQLNKLAKDFSGDDDSRFRREALANIELFEAVKSSKSTPAVFMEFYQRELENEEIPVEIRVFTGLKIINSNIHNYYRLAVPIAMPTILLYSRDKDNFPSGNPVRTLLRALGMCNDVTPEWSKAARAAADIWMRSYTSVAAGEPIRDDAVFYAMDIYSCLKDEKALDKILNLPDIKRSINTYVVLANHGHADDLSRLLNENWREIDITAKMRNFSPEGAENANRVVEKITPDDKQFYCKVLLSSVSIQKDPAVNKASRPQELLKQLEAGFGKVKFSDEQLRQECLVRMLEAGIIMKKFIPELFTVITPEKMVNDNMTSLLEYYGKTMAPLFAQGKYDEVMEHCRKFFPYLKGAKTKEYNNALQAMKSIVKAYENDLRRFKGNADDATVKKLAAFEYDLLSNVPVDEFRNLFMHSLLLNHMVGKDAESKKWIAGIPEKQLDSFETHYLRNSICYDPINQIFCKRPDFIAQVTSYLDSGIPDMIFTRDYKVQQLMHGKKDIKRNLVYSMSPEKAKDFQELADMYKMALEYNVTDKMRSIRTELDKRLVAELENKELSAKDVAAKLIDLNRIFSKIPVAFDPVLSKILQKIPPEKRREILQIIKLENKSAGFFLQTAEFYCGLWDSAPEQATPAAEKYIDSIFDSKELSTKEKQTVFLSLLDVPAAKMAAISRFPRMIEIFGDKTIDRGSFLELLKAGAKDIEGSQKTILMQYFMKYWRKHCSSDKRYGESAAIDFVLLNAMLAQGDKNAVNQIFAKCYDNHSVPDVLILASLLAAGKYELYYKYLEKHSDAAQFNASPYIRFDKRFWNEFDKSQAFVGVSPDLKMLSKIFMLCFSKVQSNWNSGNEPSVNSYMFRGKDEKTAPADVAVIKTRFKKAIDELKQYKFSDPQILNKCNQLLKEASTRNNNQGWEFITEYLQEMVNNAPDKAISAFDSKELKNEYTYVDEAMMLISSLAQKHPAMALSIAEKTYQKLLDSNKFRSGIYMTREDMIISRMISSGKDLKTLYVMYNFINKCAKNGGLRLGESYFRKLEEIARRENHSRSSERYERLRDFLVNLNQAFAGKNSPAVFRVFREVALAAGETVMTKINDFVKDLPDKGAITRQIKLDSEFLASRKRGRFSEPSEDFRKFYLEYVSDKDIAICLRFYGVREMIFSDNNKMILPEAVVPLAPELFEDWEKHQKKLNTDEMLPVLRALSIDEPSEQWNAVAAKAVKFCLDNAAGIPGSYNGERYCQALAQILIKLKDDAGLEKLLKMKKAYISLGVYGVLLNYDKIKLCAGLLEQHCDEIKVLSSRHNCTRLTADGVKNMDSVITLVKPDKKFMISVLLALLPVEEGDGYREQVNRQKKLAIEFHTVKFASPQDKTRCLEQLQVVSSNAIYLKPSLGLLFDTVASDAVLKQNNYGVQVTYAVYLYSLFDKNDMKALDARLKPVMDVMHGNTNTWNARNILSKLLEYLLFDIENLKQPVSEQDIIRRCELAEKIMTQAGPEINRDAFYLLLFLNSIYGRDKESEKWLGELTPEQLKKLDPYSLYNNIYWRGHKVIDACGKDFDTEVRKLIKSGILLKIFKDEKKNKIIKNTCDQILKRLEQDAAKRSR